MKAFHADSQFVVDATLGRRERRQRRRWRLRQGGRRVRRGRGHSEASDSKLSWREGSKGLGRARESRPDETASESQRDEARAREAPLRPPCARLTVGRAERAGPRWARGPKSSRTASDGLIKRKTICLRAEMCTRGLQRTKSARVEMSRAARDPCAAKLATWSCAAQTSREEPAGLTERAGERWRPMCPRHFPPQRPSKARKTLQRSLEPRRCRPTS